MRCEVLRGFARFSEVFQDFGRFLQINLDTLRSSAVFEDFEDFGGFLQINLDTLRSSAAPGN